MTTATVDRKAIMIAAWVAMRAYGPAGSLQDLRRRLSRELRQAWFNAKRAIQLAAMNTKETARDALNILRNKDRWTDADYASADWLAQAIAKEETDAEVATDYAEKRELIASAKGRFCSVVFTKADGTERTMVVQPAALRGHVKGATATQAGQRATIARKVRHPHLMPVWDVQAKAPRYINLATIKTITTGDIAHAYA